jgi:hypothetical protein
MPSRPSPGPRWCSPISPAIPTASPSHSRLISFDESGVRFHYRLSPQRTRALSHHDGGTGEFIRRFLLHVLPKGFHRIRHYGLLASAGCKASIARARELIAMPVPPDPPAEHDNTDQAAGAAADYRPPCPCCGSRMIIVEIFERGVWQKAGAGFALSV